MSPPLISHNGDLLALVRKGYSIRVVDGHLVVDDLPFLAEDHTVGTGRMITPLNHSGGTILKPSTHIMYWSGPEPRDANGDQIACYHSPQTKKLAEGLEVNHQYSSKLIDDRGRKRAYESYYEMVTTYARIFCDPVTTVDPNRTPYLFKPMRTEEGDTSPFVYPDTSAIRSGIVSATARFNDQTIAIVGLGGTGAYILDLVAKTRVKRILLFDDDSLLQHNAFRAPGAIPFDALAERLTKVEYFGRVYAGIHAGIEPKAVRITVANLNELNVADFVFVAIDDGPSRDIICKHLDERNVAYIDVGLGVELLEDDSLAGQLRTTLATKRCRDHVAAVVPIIPRSEEDDYHANIQVSDLNALNACLAVVRWKRFVGFYRSSRDEHHSVFRLRDGAHICSEVPGQGTDED